MRRVGPRPGGESLAEAARRHLAEIACENFGAGDVILFRWREGLVGKHGAVASARGCMIHAHDRASVSEVAIAPFWGRRLAYAFAFPGVGGAGKRSFSIVASPHQSFRPEERPKKIFFFLLNFRSLKTRAPRISLSVAASGGAP